MWNSHKIKSVKATKVFQVCISIVYDSFILELNISISISTALLFCYCGDNDLLQNTCFKENDNMVVKKKLK